MSVLSFSTACLHIAHRPDLGQLTGRWLCSVSEAELHEGYDALRRAAGHWHCGYWLIDSRRRTSRSLNGPEWITTHFLPQVQQELGTSLSVCFLVLPEYLNTLGKIAASSVPGSAVQFARFLDEGHANAWLAARQAETEL
ncbi:MAG: hypothetical protein ACRYFX_03635 [Janthinobacterium lividum]